LAAVLLTGLLASAQVPAGPPYRSEIHPNPIVTFARDADFMPVSYADAANQAGIELLGISGQTGSRESVRISSSRVEEVRILGRRTDVLFYPAVLQQFRLTGGEALELYSFRDPRPTGIPEDVLPAVLNEHAFNGSDQPEEARFGGMRPERLEIRGSEALLFERDGQFVLFWQDATASHVATAPVSREHLFRIVEDLL
jgi:hypothetical protein